MKKIFPWLFKETAKVYDYETQRFIIGLTAISLPFLVTLIYQRIITSISAYYYTVSRNIFVGLLFITGFFLLIYNGRYYYEALISKIAAICAIGTALAPTGLPIEITEYKDCLEKLIRSNESLHYFFSILLFAQLIFLCLCFARRAKLKKDRFSNARRVIYLICSGLMTASLLSFPLLVKFTPLTPEDLNRINLLFYAESTALIAFGTAWFAAGKPLMHLKRIFSRI
ncbi:MAG: hypothetical protein JXA95_16780 [Spirochaetales bacterium]|nr:hypothetical protein [Spirochaetales bacterium]